MVEINSNHRLHSPAQSLFAGLQKIVTIEEASVECRALLGHFTNKFVIVQLDPTALDHLVTKFTHEADVGRLTSEADVVDLAEHFAHLSVGLCHIDTIQHPPGRWNHEWTLFEVSVVYVYYSYLKPFDFSGLRSLTSM